jgi:hypothetical protein
LLRRDVASGAESLTTASEEELKDLWGGRPAASNRGGPFVFFISAK